MKASFSTALGILMTLTFASSVHAANIARGKQLVQENCIKCHAGIVGGDGSKIFTRANRHIDSLQALIKQVHRCKNALGVSWPEDQIADVVAYLNKTYYKFKK